MKRIIAAAIFSLSATGAHAADDFMSDDNTLGSLRGGFSWEGGYVGANAGYSGGKFKHPFSFDDGSAVLRSSVNVTSSGFSGGVQAGYNWLFDNNIVAGVEADFQGSSLKGSFGLSDVMEGGTRVQWFGTIRGRLGYTPTERLLVFATAGYAYGRVKSYLDIDGLGSDSIARTKSGWTIGGGAEYAVDDHWTLKTEYLYTDLGKMKLFDGSGGLNGSAKVNFHTVRAGVNYKF